MSYQNHYDTIWRLAKIHQSELLQEAENNRRALQAHPSRRLRYSLSSQISWRVGRALVGAGFWLLSRPHARG